MEAFTIAAPRDLDAALAAAQQGDAKFIAGGTDLMQLMKDFVERPKRLVDIDGLPLDGVTIGADGARIGALVRMADLADHAEIRRQYPVSPRRCSPALRRKSATWRRSAATCCS